MRLPDDGRRARVGQQGWRRAGGRFILAGMHSRDSRVRVAETAGGARTYLVDLAPAALPPVRPRDLAAAWDSARGAALAQHWGAPLLLRFAEPAGETTELALADADACCWAAAVDGTVGLGNTQGLSLLLRLLALVEVLPRAPWALPLVALGREGAALDPALLRAAARLALGADARFDPGALRAALVVEAALPAAPATEAALPPPPSFGALR